ncbi:polysaccharide biosynthesis tyrosine autokinase [Streptosporangium sp. NPDC048865]|uniref:polysaccharide biosynthesis tyrosine autokinase n=1 Tax=Streptosporangium sp. NPDC048865 TaxID=3155766 RepID=UPI003414B3BE
MNLLFCLWLLRKNWILIAGALALSVVTAGALTAVMPPTYAASVSMLVSTSNQEGGTSTAYQAALLSEQRMRSYANLLTSRRVIQAITEGGDVDRLRENVEAEAVPDTVLLRATVNDGDPHRAARLANSLSRAFARLIDDLESPARPPDGAKVSVSVVDRAQVPSRPVRPRLLVNVALGALIGVTVICGAIVVKDRLDTTIRTSQALRQATAVPVLGEIGFERGAGRHPLVVEQSGPPALIEAFHTLRANLQFTNTERRPRSLVVTSCLPGEGASFVCGNLAVVLAEAGLRVILVEGDLRQPSVSEHLKVGGRPGLTDVLAGRAEPSAAMRQREVPAGRLSVLPSGPLPANPSVLLGSPPMRPLIDELAGACDIVIINAPPLLPVTDAAVLAANCDGVLLVARFGKPRLHDMAYALDLLSSAGAHLLGTVLNFAPGRRGNARDYPTHASVEPAPNTGVLSENV